MWGSSSSSHIHHQNKPPHPRTIPTAWLILPLYISTNWFTFIFIGIAHSQCQHCEYNKTTIIDVHLTDSPNILLSMSHSLVRSRYSWYWFPWWLLSIVFPFWKHSFLARFWTNSRPVILSIYWDIESCSNSSQLILLINAALSERNGPDEMHIVGGKEMALKMGRPWRHRNRIRGAKGAAVCRQHSHIALLYCSLGWVGRTGRIVGHHKLNPHSVAWPCTCCYRQAADDDDDAWGWHTTCSACNAVIDRTHIR